MMFFLKKSFILIFLILRLSPEISFAEDSRAILHSGNNQRLELKEGDINQAILELIPLKNFTEEDVKKSILDPNWSSYLMLIDVSHCQPSENNIDVFVCSVVLGVKKGTALKEITLNFKSITITASLRNLALIHSGIETPKELILIRPENLPWILKYKKWIPFAISLSLFILISVFLFFLKKVYTRWKAVKNKKNIYRFWDKAFSGVRDRKDLEEIYFKKNEWIHHVNIGNKSDLNNFLFAIEQHLYKEKWDELILKDVHESFSKIKNIFRNP